MPQHWLCRAWYTYGRMHAASATCLLAVCAAVACDDGVIVEIGVIEQDGPAQIQVPTTARVGEPALIQVTTYGGGCVSVETTEVVVTDDGAEITPYDRRREGNCTAIRLEFDHNAAIRFDTPGLKVIRVNGRKMYFGGGEFQDELVQRTFSMNVEAP